MLDNKQIVYQSLRKEFNLKIDDLSIFAKSKRNLTFCLRYKNKNWLAKLYSTDIIEKRAIKEYFFYERIFPMLYDKEVEILCFKKIECTEYYLLVIEMLELYEIDFVDKKISQKIILLLKKLHYNDEIRLSLKDRFETELDYFGEIYGQLDYLKNSYSSLEYFENIISYWEKNILTFHSGNEIISLFLKLKQYIFNVIGELEETPYFVHSDTNLSNFMTDKYGNIILIDFENFFSFHKELDFIPLFFPKEFGGNNHNIEYRVDKNGLLSQIYDIYFEKAISLDCLKNRVDLLSCYKILRHWNYSLRMNKKELNESIIKVGFDFITHLYT